MKTASELSSWKQHTQLILAQIDGLQSWFEREQRTLTAKLFAQLREIETEIRMLESEIEPTGGTRHADRMVAQIEALKARSDMVYELLRTTQDQLGSPEASNR